MKEKLSIILILFIFVLSGCVKNENSQKSQANAILDEMIIALEDNDTQTIKSMFSTKVQETLGDELDEQIEEMTKYFEGDVVSYEKIRTVSGGESIDKGVLTYSSIGNAKSKKVMTDKDQYTISFSAILIDDKKENEGIWRIWIGTSEDDYLIVGISDMPLS